MSNGSTFSPKIKKYDLLNKKREFLCCRLNVKNQDCHKLRNVQGHSFFFFITSKQISQYRQNVYEIKYKQLFMDFVKTKLSLF
jgi:hypothetical protein